MAHHIKALNLRGWELPVARSTDFLFPSHSLFLLLQCSPGHLKGPEVVLAKQMMLLGGMPIYRNPKSPSRRQTMVTRTPLIQRKLDSIGRSASKRWWILCRWILPPPCREEEIFTCEHKGLTELFPLNLLLYIMSSYPVTFVNVVHLSMSLYRKIIKTSWITEY